MCQRLSTILFAMLAILLIGVPVGQAQTVADFTILGPRLVLDDDQNNEVTFTIYVAANDSNWQPLLPGSQSAITLTAFEAGSQNPLTISAGASFQSSATEIWNAVPVTLTGVNHSTEVTFQATGFNIGPSGSNASSTRVVGASNNETNNFQVSTPRSAIPNQPFPLIITPARAEQNDPNAQPAPFTGDVTLTVDDGTITPTTVSLALQAGESHQVMVTLDAVNSGNTIHVTHEIIGGPTPEHNVVFKNEDQAQISNSSNFTIHAHVFQDDTTLTARGVTTTTEWQSTIWPIDEDESDQFGGGWNMMTSIPGLGDKNQGLQFHDIFIPKIGPQGAVAIGDLPGNQNQTYWNEQTIVLGPGGWNIVTGSFPDSLAGDYWHRRFFLSHGQFPKIDATFDYHSAMFDQVLKDAELDGTPGNNDQNSLSDVGVKGTTWAASLWRTAFADTVYHMYATFSLNDGPVSVFLSFTPATRTGPGGPNIFIPDSLWNQNYQTLASEFQNPSGGALPADFTTGTFWNRLKVLRAPGDGNQSYEGWSQSINTTGEHVITTTLKVNRTLIQPGGLAEVFVTLDHVERDVAGIQFDLPVPPNTTFLGAINFQDGAGFNISANTVNDTTTFLMTNLGGGKLVARDTDILMKLIYQIAPAAAIGDFLDLELDNTVLSDPTSNSIEHNRENGGIAIGLIGDLAGASGPDGAINVTDLVHLINIIIGVNASPTPEDLEFSKADINRDMAINILDAQRIINIITGRATAKQIAGSTDAVRVELGALNIMKQGQMTLPVQIQSDGPIAGIQLTLSYDPGLVSLGTIIPDARLDGMFIEQHASAGELRILIISPDGGTFTASTLSAILELPVILHDKQGGEVTMSELIVANTQAVALQTIVTGDRVKVGTAPAAFALIGNQPNPFNPSTQIAYEVPEQSHITLTIFNLLGQEVIRLVDQVQSPGRYLVTWNARNARGLSVSSGVYLYRLTSGAGAVDTKRMTLLK